MFCHIVFKSEYSYRYFQLIEKYFSLNDHFFIIHGEGLCFQEQKYHYKNFLSTKDFSESEVINLIENASAIIINGFFSGELAYFFYRYPQYLSKLNWLTWGDDIFRLKNTDFNIDIFNISFESLISLVIQKIRFIKRNIQTSIDLKVLPFRYGISELYRIFVIKKMSGIIGMEKDFEIIYDIYKTQARYIYGFHPFLINWSNSNYYIEVLKTKNNQNNLQPREINILLGNSGSETNQHSEYLEIVAKNFAYQNLKVFCPLSYGNKDYIDKVIKEGKNLLGKSFNPITSLMSPEEYILFLSNIDVALMNHKVQEGVGTIITLILLGAKVYMNPEISSYSFLTKQQIKIFDIQELKKIRSAQLLLFENDRIIQENQDNVIKAFSEVNWVLNWKQIFRSIAHKENHIT